MWVVLICWLKCNSGKNKSVRGGWLMCDWEMGV